MSRFEAAARTRKVIKLVERIPRAHSETEQRTLAEVLASWPQADRDVFARNAGVTSPSEETWRLVVECVRGRDLAGSDPFRRVAP